MGSLQGHILPGVIFITIGILTTIKYVLYYFRMKRYGGSNHLSQKLMQNERCQSKQEVIQIQQDMMNDCASDVKYRNNSTCCPSTPSTESGEDDFKSESIATCEWDPSSIISFATIECYMIVTFILIGFVGEFVTAFEPDGSMGMHNVQHMTMYMGFIFVPLSHIYTNKMAKDTRTSNVIVLKDPLLRGLDMWLLTLGFSVEALLFAWHLHGRSPLDVQVHTFVLYTVMNSIFTCILIAVRDLYDIKLRIMLSGSLILQGVWISIVGFVLYPPEFMVKLDENTHKTSMIVTAMFAWSIMFVILLQFGVYKFLSPRRKNETIDVY